MTDTALTALQKLIQEKKGKTAFKPGEAFLLTVFWEAPSEAAAEKLLDALHQCAQATHRDTPCVPTYFFRISSNDANLYGEAPKLVKDHAQLAAAKKKLSVGISRNAVEADLQRRNISPSYLDLELSEDLPPALQGQTPVALEFTEVYLDERAFMEHAGSREYLDGYGIVMTPGLSNHTPTTLRFGTPSQNMVDKILDPILKENVVSLSVDSTVWKSPGRWSESNFMISIDFDSGAIDSYVFSKEFQGSCAWMVRYAHPIRNGVSRLMAVFPSLNDMSPTGFEELARLNPLRGETHVANTNLVEPMKRALAEVGLSSLITVNATRSVGYFLHEKAAELQPE